MIGNQAKCDMSGNTKPKNLSQSLQISKEFGNI